ncbi:hypothetical protein BGZ99_009544 [Dissophora globulifera]|uniref:GHMP kinase N-terminal domain-containing protein n=1 Tax=Dissophora globulifera TaxID=979702 RepID=A0A9P6R4B0_9FUNG|nr:hypothetical protein BGZ99_009544 [Dissophora globulifera]
MIHTQENATLTGHELRASDALLPQESYYSSDDVTPDSSPETASVTTSSATLTPASVPVPRGTFVYASAPARIDLAGGWTDTIPITLILTLSYDPSIPPEHYHSLDQIRDHADPLMPCALLKACIVASGIIGITPARHDDVPYKSIAEALKHSGGGLEIIIRSSLPLGSGMGTSSILAAAVLAVLKTLKGEPYTTDDLVYLTLDVEQMMNTGGGWQDQVGGIMPGFKVSTCELGLPIQIDAKPMNLPGSFLDTFNSRLLLIYTGQTRLAKNLLQTVLMNWAGQEPVVVNTMHRLVDDATTCESALLNEDLTSVGMVLLRYFADKRFLSNTSLNHPPVVRQLVTLLEPFIEGASLAGAGGGGFLVALLKPGLRRDEVVSTVRNAMTKKQIVVSDQTVDQDIIMEETIQQESEAEDDQDSMWEWQATVDTTGLVVRIGEAPS